VDAQTAMLDAAQAMERCFTRENTYSTCGAIGNTFSTDRYDVLVAAGADGNGFTITATPQDAFDRRCTGAAELSLDHLGRREPPNCW
jgi:type IV pilus assembly protein PilE